MRKGREGRRTTWIASFLRSQFGVVLMAFMVTAAVLLIYEHRAHLVTGDWLLVGLVALCVGMHVFMHAGHGGSGGPGHDGDGR